MVIFGSSKNSGWGEIYGVELSEFGNVKAKKELKLYGDLSYSRKRSLRFFNALDVLEHLRFG